MDLCTEDIYRSVFKEYPDILDVKDVCTLLGVSPKVVYRLLNNEIIVSLKVGRAFRIPKVNVMRYVKIFGSQIYERPTS